ncbi:hypothetical protein ACN28S_07910 [Cystobacter fuscus]
MDDLHESFAHLKVGGSSRARTTQPGWRVSSAARGEVDAVLLNQLQKPISGATVTQYISQQENPQFSSLPGSGACSAITTNWFEAGMNAQDSKQASADFNSRLKSTEHLVDQQAEYLRKHGHVKQLYDDRSAAAQDKANAEQELFTHKAEYERMAQWARNHGLHPDDQRYYNQLEARKGSISKSSREYSDINREQLSLTSTALDNALSPRQKKELQRTQTDFLTAKQDVIHFHNEIQRLDQAIPQAIEAVENHENAGLQKNWTEKYSMRNSASSLGVRSRR